MPQLRAASRHDMVITDLMMPKKDGVAAIALRKQLVTDGAYFSRPTVS